jgi:hypothetical protein
MTGAEKNLLPSETRFMGLRERSELNIVKNTYQILMEWRKGSTTV